MITRESAMRWKLLRNQRLANPGCGRPLAAARRPSHRVTSPDGARRSSSGDLRGADLPAQPPAPARSHSASSVRSTGMSAARTSSPRAAAQARRALGTPTPHLMSAMHQMHVGRSAMTARMRATSCRSSIPGCPVRCASQNRNLIPLVALLPDVDSERAWNARYYC